MITEKKPESKTLSPKTLYDILCSDVDKNVHVIENILQRELVWDYPCIETFWHDVLTCIELNVEGKKSGLFDNVFDKAFMVGGNIEYSTVDKCNEKYIKELENGVHKSIVDGSQRNRISIFIIIAFLYEKCKINQNEIIDLSPFMLPNGEFKLIEIGINGMDDFYKKLSTTSISKLEKEIKPLDKLVKLFNKEDCERDYFDTFSIFVHFIEKDIIGQYDINDAFTIAMRNIYFYEEEIDEENKFDRFIDRNKKGTPMSDEFMYPKYIINQFDGDEKEDIYKAFKRFKDRAEYCENNFFFRKTKNGICSVLYSMIEVLKIKLASVSKSMDIDNKHVFNSAFNLGNIEYGVEKCFRNNILFTSAEETIKYFNECYAFVDFLINDSFVKKDNIYDECYYFRDFAKHDLIWWYFIKPLYITKKLYKDTNRERFAFIKNALYRLYVFYIVHRVSDTNSQNMINLLENISFLLIVNDEKDDEEFEKVIKKEAMNYINKAEENSPLCSIIPSLSYNIKGHKNAMDNIFIALEFDIIEKNELPTDTFFTLWKRNKGKSFNLDHWLPENKIIQDELEFEYQKIGNMVILEDSLNKSKQDNTDVNSKYYTQSKYIQTLLMDNTNRGTFQNKILDSINNNKSLYRLSTEEINNPTLENIRKRTQFYTKFFISFIKDFFKEKEI